MGSWGVSEYVFKTLNCYNLQNDVPSGFDSKKGLQIEKVRLRGQSTSVFLKPHLYDIENGFN